LSESRPARFVGCHAIVTGAASGIGRSISKALAAEGAFVHLVDRQEDGLKETQAAIDSPSEAHVVDISEESQVRQMVSGVVDSADGRIDVLVNCAGTYDIRPLLEVTIDSWEDVLSTNLRGTFLVCREAARHMALRGRGAIVNLSSVAAFVGDPSEPAVHYNASKAGVLGLTTQLAVELAPSGIRVNAICPGVIDTPMLRMMKRDPEAGRRFLRESVPLGRLGTAEEVAALALFLASDEASYITGAAVPIDGGLLAL
jgi:NAD(P)-dependent dehydrogenase (short-subunit alcohol dehydrogenase family)